ncbi:MAG: hypothetical protein K1X72_06520 [Pyrinomonadaceae bacterium]|nr:hypothetical protein [Pyrinomonadaceae bacterium]
MKIIFLVLCFVIVANGQQPDETKQLCDKRAKQVAKTLEPNNILRTSIEEGERGDCIHQTWMDKMQKLGVKQASFLVEYSWKNGNVKFKVLNVSYFRAYFSTPNLSEIKDGKNLREIKQSGLEQELKDAVIAQSKDSPFATYKKGQVKTDSFTANLLDDEALPIFWVIS